MWARMAPTPTRQSEISPSFFLRLLLLLLVLLHNTRHIFLNFSSITHAPGNTERRWGHAAQGLLRLTTRHPNSAPQSLARILAINRRSVCARLSADSSCQEETNPTQFAHSTWDG